MKASFCHMKVSETIHWISIYGGFITRFVPAQGLELAGKPYAWIKRIPNSSCARLSAGIARPVTWKILFFFY
jgi:hypothetical protein